MNIAKAPWKTGSTEDGRTEIIDTAGRVVAVVRSDVGHDDAILIAAAPDLLAAAERMIRDQDRPAFSMDFRGAIAELRAAIAKAGGAR